MKPDRFAPPAVFIGPGSPYITRQDATFGGEIVRHQITAVVATGTNEARAIELDDLVLDVLGRLYDLPPWGEHQQPWGVGDVQQPGQISVGNQPHLAVAIEVAIEIHRAEQ